jgi:hypothetical protein
MQDLDKLQCFGSGFIYSGSRSRVLMTKNRIKCTAENSLDDQKWKKCTTEKIIIFL